MHQVGGCLCIKRGCPRISSQDLSVFFAQDGQVHGHGQFAFGLSTYGKGSAGIKWSSIEISGEGSGEADIG